MNDDIFERFIKSIGIVLGGFLLLYCLIVTTQKHPRGIALKIVVVTEFVAKGLFYIGLGIGIISLLTPICQDRCRVGLNFNIIGRIRFSNGVSKVFRRAEANVG